MSTDNLLSKVLWDIRSTSDLRDSCSLSAVNAASAAVRILPTFPCQVVLLSLLSSLSISFLLQLLQSCHSSLLAALIGIPFSRSPIATRSGKMVFPFPVKKSLCANTVILALWLLNGSSFTLTRWFSFDHDPSLIGTKYNH